MSERSPSRPEESPPPGPEHPLGRMFLIGTVASIIGVVFALAIDWFPVNAAADTEKIDTLYDVLMIVSVPIFVLVMTVAIYSVIRYRARPGDMGDGAPIHGNTKLEIIWVAVPTVIVSALAAYAWIVLDDVEAKQPDELQVRVVSQQFAWSFEYPQHGNFRSTQLYLPQDRPVRFDIVTRDVLHSFWVPSFRLKQDSVPGLTTSIRLTPTRLGQYDVVCAELCGIGHSTMRQYANVVEPEEFDRWVAEQQEAAGGGEAGGGGEEGGQPAPSDPAEPGDSASSDSNRIPAG